MTESAAGTYAGKVAFVTGADSGIGRATAIAFAKAGLLGVTGLSRR